MKTANTLFLFGVLALMPYYLTAQVKIDFNSTNVLPHLILEESGNDFARLYFRNLNSTSGENWSVNGKISTTDADSRFRIFYDGISSSGAPLVITGDLNIGIGTSDPSTLLTLKQNLDQDDMGFGIINASGTGSGRMWMNGNDLKVYAGNNSGNGLTFKPTGRIGAFTGDPDAKFAIYESDPDGMVDLFLVSRLLQNDKFFYTIRILEAKHDGDVYIRRLGVYEDTPTHQLDINTGDADSNPLRVRIQDVTKLRVLSNGGTSIGSGNSEPPADGLHVEGQCHVGTNSAGTDRLQVRSEVDENPFRVIVDNETKLRVLSNGGTSIGSNNETPPENGLYVNGNLHIGTNAGATGYKLAVNGKAICEELTVELSGDWPDYVFEPDYDLVPLETVYDYIQTHKHLPGIPSAADIEAEGIHISETIVKLLEKVEELTLHAILQENRIQELEAQAKTFTNK